VVAHCGTFIYDPPTFTFFKNLQRRIRMFRSKTIRILLLVVLIFAGRAVYAQTINVNEFQPLPAEPKSSGWDSGFYLRSADDNFKMKVGGKVQVQQITQKKTGLQKIFNSSTGRFTTPDSFSDTFAVRRASIMTSGTIYEKVDWAAVVQTSTGQPGTATQRILFLGDVAYNVAPYFSIDMGMVSLPFEKSVSSSWLLAVEPPVTATQTDGLKDLTIARQSFGPSDDLGLTLSGDVGKYFRYEAGVVNGSGFIPQNADNNLSYGGRLQFNVMGSIPPSQTDFAWSETPNVVLGLGTIYEDVQAPDDFVATTTRKWDWSSVGDFAFRYRGFALNGAGYYRKSKYISTAGVPVVDTNADGYLIDKGYYANAGYYVMPKKLELQINAAQIFREGADNDANEFGGGLNWYIHKNNVKLQLDYSRVLDYDAVPGLNNATYHRVRTMFSLIL